MAVTYRTSLKTTRMNAVVTDIGASGKLEIGTAGMGSVLATIALGNPAGTVTDGVLTLSGFPRSDTAADATGTAAAARIRDGSNNDIITGLTVGTAASDIILNVTTVVLGIPVTINSAVITHG